MDLDEKIDDKANRKTGIYDFSLPILNLDEEEINNNSSENSNDDSYKSSPNISDEKSQGSRYVKKKNNSKDINSLVDDLNVQMQVATFWKEKFMDEFNKYNSEFPFFLLDIEKYLDPLTTKFKDVTSDSSDETESLPCQFSELDIDHFLNIWDTCKYHIQYGAPNYVFHLSTEILNNAWNSTRKDLLSVKNVSLLVDMFEHCVVAACTYQSVNELGCMKKFFAKAIDLLQLLFFYKEAQNDREYAQKLVNILILLYYLYTLNDSQIPRHSIIGLACQVISMHRDVILQDTIHRVLSYMELFREMNAPSEPIIIKDVISFDPQQKHNNINQLINILMVLHPKERYEELNPILTNENCKYLISTIMSIRNYFNSDEVLAIIPKIIRKKLLIFSNGFMVELHYKIGENDKLDRFFKESIELIKNIECWSLMDSIGIYLTLLTAARTNKEYIVNEGLKLIEKYSKTHNLMKRYIENIGNLINGKPLKMIKLTGI